MCSPSRFEAPPSLHFVRWDHSPLPRSLEFQFINYKRCTQFLRDWQLFLEKYPVLICPTSSEPPFPDLLDLEDFPRVIKAQLTQVGLPLMGIPGLSIFTGYNESPDGKIPMGAQLVGARFREDILISAAKEIEVRSPEIEIAEP